jgi:hypothetical protein
MGQQTLGGADITQLRDEYYHLVSKRLPDAARERGDWPIQADHCFGRVVLDTLFEDEWYDHVDGRPAYQHISPTELRDAITIARLLLDEGAAGGRTEPRLAGAAGQTVTGRRRRHQSKSR